MKLETKISLLFIIILFIIGAVFLMTGFSALDLLNISLGNGGWLTYVLFLLLLIGILILFGRAIDHQIRKPLFFFIRWIDRLSLGDFKRPDAIKNFSPDRIRFRSFNWDAGRTLMKEAS